MLPQDPLILLSYVNTKLPDEYPTLDELCRAEDADPGQLCRRLEAAGFSYDPARNQFR